MSTYTATVRVPHQVGEDTTDLTAHTATRPELPRRHLPVLATGAALAALAVLTLVVYGFVAADPTTPRPARSLLVVAGLTMLVLSGACGLAAHLLHTARDLTQHATAAVLAEVAGLRGELRLMSTCMAAEVRAARAELPDRLGERLDLVERRAEDLHVLGQVFGSAGNGRVRQLRSPDAS